MNMLNNPAIEDLKSLLSQYDDLACDHVLWVGYDGEVQISEIHSQEDWIEWKRRRPLFAKFYYERFHRGNNNVGPFAANNDEIINEYFWWLKADWDRGAEGDIEIPGYV